MSYLVSSCDRNRTDNTVWWIGLLLWPSKKTSKQKFSQIISEDYFSHQISDHGSQWAFDRLWQSSVWVCGLLQRIILQPQTLRKWAFVNWVSLILFIPPPSFYSSSFLCITPCLSFIFLNVQPFLITVTNSEGICVQRYSSFFCW